MSDGNFWVSSGPLHAHEDRALDRTAVPAQRRQRKVRAVTCCPQRDILHAERLTQTFQVIGALVSVEGVEIDAP